MRVERFNVICGEMSLGISFTSQAEQFRETVALLCVPLAMCALFDEFGPCAEHVDNDDDAIHSIACIGQFSQKALNHTHTKLCHDWYICAIAKTPAHINLCAEN